MKEWAHSLPKVPSPVCCSSGASACGRLAWCVAWSVGTPPASSGYPDQTYHSRDLVQEVWSSVKG